MIARIWNGTTAANHYEEYSDFLIKIAIPDYKKTSGFIKLSFLRKIENNKAYFTLITYWENIQVIKNFAGEQYELTKYYPKDKKYLLEFAEKVTHFEVFAMP